MIRCPFALEKKRYDQKSGTVIALIGQAELIEKILGQLHLWDPQPETRAPSGPDPPWRNGETLPLTYHPVPRIA